MAVTIRVNEDNYQSIKELADKERRSVVAQLGVILDEYFHRDTVGAVTPQETPPSPKNTEVKTPKNDFEATPIPIEPPFKPLPEPVIPNPMPDVDDILGRNREQECCQHPTRPCKHWVWDNDMGDGYKNTLSGRQREAD